MNSRFFLLAPALCAIVVAVVAGNSNPITDVQKNNPYYREGKVTIDAKKASASGQTSNVILSVGDDGSVSTATTARFLEGQQ